MSTRAELVARWQDQLALSESLLDTTSLRLRWLWHMRARLYRFLLSCYGEGAWEPEQAPLAEERRPAVLVDNTANLAGLQPKSADRIRATLESVKVAIDRAAPQGPLVHGLTKRDWIRVAAFRHALQANRLLLALAEANLDAQTWRQGRWFVVDVQRLDYDAALQIAREVREEARLRRTAPSPTSQPISCWQTFGASIIIIGTMVCLVCLLMSTFIMFVPTPVFTYRIVDWCLVAGIIVSFWLSVWATERLVQKTSRNSWDPIAESDGEQAMGDD